MRFVPSAERDAGVTSGDETDDGSVRPLGAARHAAEPLPDGGADVVGSHERQRALDADGDVGAETNLGAQRLG